MITAETGFTASAVADQSVTYVLVPVVTTETFGLTSASCGSTEPGENHSGVVEKPSSAVASTAKSSPARTLMRVIEPNRPPVPATVSVEAVREVVARRHAADVGDGVVRVLSVTMSPISMIST